ncbi:tetratricopeptide repeat protein [Helicobacter canis]|uniref:Tetratricopeptide repeat protein n=1 Tax=Helicobacter canis TaxID=29419 RepID=A0A5M9QH34_9HELI|nr:tetratricopeptide repeat protein [Helicobacter canis]KAA8707698.1 tetratricopeptide repeat protein [Helicobacter canis]
MAINTSTLASIYEMQGHTEEAIVIYEEMIKRDPNNAEAKSALIRLKTKKHKFSGVNEDKLVLFVNATTQSDYQKLEQWLLG